MNEKYFSAEKKRKEKLQKLLDEKRKRERLLYERDQKEYFERRNLSMTRKKEEDQEVSKALEDFERNMTQHQQNKQHILKKTAEKAQKHIEYVNFKCSSNKHQKDFLENDVDFRIKLEKSLKRQIDHIKQREKELKYFSRQKHEKIEKNLENARLNLKQRDRDLLERNKKIMKWVNEKDNIIKQRKKLLEHEVVQKHEIQKLKREHQMFNFRREQAMMKDYKLALMEKLQEKAKKANMAKERSKTAGSMLNMTMI